MELLFGKPVANEILTHLKSEIALSTEKPGLAVVLVGDDEASKIYVNLKEKRAQEIGMNFFRYDLPASISEKELLVTIENLDNDKLVHGIIVQLPLPQGFDTEKIINTISSKKDADGIIDKNTQNFLQGNDEVWPVFPKAILKLLKSSKVSLEGKKAVVLANSEEFGRVMASALQRENLSSEYILSKNIPSNLEQIAQANVLVSAMGSPGLLRGEMFKDGAIVIDGGIDKVGEKVFGDVDFASTKGKNGYLSPVPGGVGPLTIACLLENVYLAFKAQQKEK